MSWLYSQALVEEYLGENFLDGEQSAPLNGKPIQQAYCAPDKMTVFSRLSRFGMTYKPLTEDRGEELLTLYLADFHAKTLAPLEKAQELTENDQECGEKWRGWLAKYDPDTSLWRTAQCSLLEDLNESLETLPRSGMTRNGLLWELPMLEQTIKGTESGFLEKWATPTTMDKLPPKSQQALLKEATQARPGRSKPANLRDQVSNMQNWPTPTAHMAKETNAPSEHNRNTPTLTAQVNWATPTVCGNYNRKGLSKTSGDGLATQVGGKLNPTWVEWLMGWPLGWTDLKPLETVKYPYVPQLHGES